MRLPSYYINTDGVHNAHLHGRQFNAAQSGPHQPRLPINS